MGGCIILIIVLLVFGALVRFVTWTGVPAANIPLVVILLIVGLIAYANKDKDE